MENLIAQFKQLQSDVDSIAFNRGVTNPFSHIYPQAKNLYKSAFGDNSEMESMLYHAVSSYVVPGMPIANDDRNFKDQKRKIQDCLHDALLFVTRYQIFAELSPINTKWKLLEGLRRVSKLEDDVNLQLTILDFRASISSEDQLKIYLNQLGYSNYLKLDTQRYIGMYETYLITLFDSTFTDEFDKVNFQPIHQQDGIQIANSIINAKISENRNSNFQLGDSNNMIVTSTQNDFFNDFMALLEQVKNIENNLRQDLLEFAEAANEDIKAGLTPKKLIWEPLLEKGAQISGVGDFLINIAKTIGYIK